MIRSYQHRGVYNTSQKYNVAACFDILAESLIALAAPVARVIELGTSVGGFTLYLCDRFPQAQIYSFDRLTPLYADALNACENLVLVKDEIFAPSVSERIGGLVSQPGVTLLLCDNGDKIREFNHFASFLKPGDLILAHDYQETPEARDPEWHWTEIWDDAVAVACQEYGLERYCYEVMWEAAWLCCRKRPVENEPQSGWEAPFHR